MYGNLLEENGDSWSTIEDLQPGGSCILGFVNDTEYMLDENAIVDDGLNGIDANNFFVNNDIEVGL